jgi:hypothetical protein
MLSRSGMIMTWPPVLEDEVGRMTEVVVEVTVGAVFVVVVISPEMEVVTVVVGVWVVVLVIVVEAESWWPVGVAASLSKTLFAMVGMTGPTLKLSDPSMSEEGMAMETVLGEDCLVLRKASGALEGSTWTIEGMLVARTGPCPHFGCHVGTTILPERKELVGAGGAVWIETSPS